MRAAIYTRLSHDKTGEGLAVERQETDCRAMAEQHGWQVSDVYCDNSISAFSGAPRPAYEQLLAGIQQGEIDVVVAWSHDRLNRRPRELERYVEICEKAQVNTYTVKAGHFDLSTPAGRAVARTLAAWANYETETSTARVKAAKLQAAKSGKWAGGNRAYGWKQNGMEFEPAEQAIVLEMAKRVIAGESFRSIAIDLNERGIPTAKGNRWLAINVQRVLNNKHHVGIRVHNGQEYPAQWPRMFDEDTELRLYTAMAQSRALYRQKGPVRQHLLSGFVFCVCGNKMVVAGRDGNSLRYVCKKIDHTGKSTGCGKVSRAKDPLEYLVIESVLYRLETPQLEAAVARESRGTDDRDLSRLLTEQQAQQTRLQEIMDDYGANLIDKAEYTAFKGAATARLEALGREIATQTSQHASLGIPTGQSVRTWWETADIGQKRQVLSLLIERIVIRPSLGSAHMPNSERFMGRWRFRPADVEVRWQA